MRKRKKDRKALTLSRETVATLDARSLEELRGGAIDPCTKESQVICSVQHTCVSCRNTDATCA